MPLADPILELYGAAGVVVASNDNWLDSQSADIAATGLAPSDALEAAILIKPARRAYTAVTLTYR